MNKRVKKQTEQEREKEDQARQGFILFIYYSI